LIAQEAFRDGLVHPFFIAEILNETNGFCVIISAKLAYLDRFERTATPIFDDGSRFCFRKAR